MFWLKVLPIGNFCVASQILANVLMKNAYSSKITEKYPSGHILENKSSIRYHCKMAHLDLYFQTKNIHRNLLPSPIKIHRNLPPPPPTSPYPHKKYRAPKNPAGIGFKVLIFADTKFCRYIISQLTHPQNVF